MNTGKQEWHQDSFLSLLKSIFSWIIAQLNYSRKNKSCTLPFVLCLIITFIYTIFEILSFVTSQFICHRLIQFIHHASQVLITLTLGYQPLRKIFPCCPVWSIIKRLSTQENDVMMIFAHLNVRFDVAPPLIPESTDDIQPYPREMPLDDWHLRLVRPACSHACRVLPSVTATPWANVIGNSFLREVLLPKAILGKII